jgi:RNA polymerase sigma-70 factor (ECF subfamily)
MKQYPDDRELVIAVLAGQRRAFEELIRQYERLVHHLLLPFLKNSSDRKDVMQDVFVKVYENLHTFRFESKLSTWIGNIAYNTAVNFRAKQKNAWHSNHGILDSRPHEMNQGEDSVNVIPDDSPLQDEKLIKQEGSQLLAGAIEKLPDIQKSALILFHKEEMSLEEISEILELPVNTVKSHLFRARRKLKELLLHHRGEDYAKL